MIRVFRGRRVVGTRRTGQLVRISLEPVSAGGRREVLDVTVAEYDRDVQKINIVSSGVSNAEKFARLFKGRPASTSA